MLVDFLFFGVVAILIVPTICGYYAHTHGRSFWLWFAIGCMLPIVSYIILLLLPDKTHPLEKELEEVRIKNNILGTKPDFPFHEAQLRHLVRTSPLHTINFEVLPSNISEYDTVEPFINGARLKELITRIERPLALKDEAKVLAGAYEGLPTEFVLLPALHWLGKPHLFYKDKKKNPAILVCNESGMMENWALMAKIEVFPRHIVWRKFYQLQRKEKWIYKDLGPFIFDKMQYMEALQMLQKKII